MEPHRAINWSTWAGKSAYDPTAKKPAGVFRNNFLKYQSGASADVRAAGV